MARFPGGALQRRNNAFGSRPGPTAVLTAHQDKICRNKAECGAIDETFVLAVAVVDIPEGDDFTASLTQAEGVGGWRLYRWGEQGALELPGSAAIVRSCPMRGIVERLIGLSEIVFEQQRTVVEDHQ